MSDEGREYYLLFSLFSKRYRNMENIFIVLLKHAILIFSLMQLYQKIFKTSFVGLGCTSIKVLKTFYVKSLEMSSN